MLTTRSPAQRFAIFWLAALLLAALTVYLALEAPSLGLRFSPTAEGRVIIAAAPAASGIPAGAEALALTAADGRRLALEAADLIEEPDFYDSYAEMDAFFARQAALTSLLEAQAVHLLWALPGGEAAETALLPRKRRMIELPFAFWFQLAVGLSGLLIAGWVFAVRPGELAVRLFAVTGCALPLSALSAAIYSTRELALPEDLFRLLSHANHLGATLFGMALVALFLVYPRPLVAPSRLIAIPAVFLPWYLADALRFAPDLDWGVRLPLFLELGLSIAFAFWQWRKSRHDPLARAALRWCALSILIGSSLFLALVPGYSSLGHLPPLAQSYAFGFFLIMYAGIALGLRRYRLFDIDEWAWRILLWLAAAALVVLLDVLFILVGIGQALSLGASLLVAGWLYFPLRQWLWSRLVERKAPGLEELLPQLSDFAFLADGTAREAHWDALLKRAFDPLEIRRAADGKAAVELREEGLALFIPAMGGLAPRCLRYAAAGRRLFSTRDWRFAEALHHLAEQILLQRQSAEQGAREERQRLARDLHDNLGARLLRLIHHLRGTPDAELAREAMKDLRDAIAAIDAPPGPLDAALSDWRAETAARCEAAGVALLWNEPPLPPLEVSARIKAALGAALREAVSNALKHATPSAIEVRVEMNEDELVLTIANDGAPSDPAQWREGYGLRSLRARLHGLGGAFSIAEREGRVSLSFTIPRRRLAA
ncbi:MAG: hypothetical protein N3C63_05400 [Rhodocyclaceae bacterium]|nr:hypothetical protein [Rhodocyclaceae bacterium]